mgnify:CR=1 FL=1
MKVLIVNSDWMFKHMFLDFGYDVFETNGRNFEDPDEELVKLADFICFTGGADISPEIYRHKKHLRTGNDPQRDLYEITMYNLAKSHNKPCVGVCRGAQLLNCLSGGIMYQHVEGHANNGHNIYTVDSQVIFSSSTHHQMMFPSQDGILIAWGDQQQLREYYLPLKRAFISVIGEKDPEIVYYPNSKCLCVQGHPEYPGYGKFTAYFQQLLKEYME